MTKLLRPDNLQPGEYVATVRGYVCLRTSCITPAVRWFPLAQIEAVNPVYACAAPPPIQGGKAQPVMVVTLTPEQAANVNASAGVVIKVVEPVSLFHESMTNAA